MDPTTRQALAPTLPVGSAPERGGALVGQVFGDRYEILDFLGEGGMGEVYRARDRELDDLVALKVLKPTLSSRPDLVARFRREVKLARRVTHRAVARTFELGAAGGVRFLTMEFVDGEPLSRVLARRGPLPVEACARLAIDVCDALEAAHEVGVVHRDIKPDNVLVTPDRRAVVTDFGVARLASDGSDDTSGTPAYMAPEQVRGEPPTAASDLYALGVTLFECCTGRLPFSGPTPVAAMLSRLSTAPPDPRSVAPGIPDAFAALVLRTLALRPEDRPRSAGELRAELSALGPRSLPPAALEIETPDLARPPITAIEILPASRAPAGVSYLTSALSDELTLRVGRIPRVRLVSDPSATPDVVLSGTVVAGGTRVVAQAIWTATGETLWSGRIPLEAARLAPAADAISRFLSVALETPRPRASAAASATPEVLDLCQRARFLHHGGIEVDLSRAIALFEEARARAPGEPVVLAGWAMAFTRHAFFASDPPASLAEAEAAVREALAGAPLLPEAHLAAGHVALHAGDPVGAARKFRDALGLSPAWPEAHEWLGRMLLEAGFIDDAVRRLSAAMRLDPQLGALRAEIARAHALNGRWGEVDAILGELAGSGRERGRFVSRVRLAAWRGTPQAMADVQAAYARAPRGEIFDPPFVDALMRALGDRSCYATLRPLFEERASRPFASQRRSCFYAQVAAEVAFAADDREAGLSMLRRAVQLGLFDRHWLEGCPFFAEARRDGAFAAIHAEVERRALAVLDALYGE